MQPAGSTGGENYGWNIFEGSACFDPDPHPHCPDPPDRLHRARARVHAHEQGCSVTGGFVYRGCALPDLRGHVLLRRLLHALHRDLSAGSTAW